VADAFRSSSSRSAAADADAYESARDRALHGCAISASNALKVMRKDLDVAARSRTIMSKSLRSKDATIQKLKNELAEARQATLSVDPAAASTVFVVPAPPSTSFRLGCDIFLVADHCTCCSSSPGR